MDRKELLIEADELAALINSPEQAQNLRLFDATVVLDPNAEKNGHAKYAENHLPGAAFLDHAALSDATSNLMYMLPGEAELAQAIGNLGIGNDHTVVVYSTDMMPWATRVWWVLQYAGHRNVRVLNGGLAAWQGELETGSNVYPQATFTPELSPDMFATKEEVMQAIQNGGACVANTLTPEMYRGETGVFYDGHISGSVNHPMTELLDGLTLPDNETLRVRFAAQMQGDRLITYCGGGIAATLNACVAKLLGIQEVAVYDGSMSEWLAEALPTSQGAEPGAMP